MVLSGPVSLASLTSRRSGAAPDKGCVELSGEHGPGAGGTALRGAADCLLTSAETRTRIKCSQFTLENLVRAGVLEKVYVFTGVRYRQSQVDHFIRNGTGRVPAGEVA